MTRVTIGLLCVSALFFWTNEIALAQNNVSLGRGSSSYNRFYWGLNSSKLNDLLLSASFPVEMGNWTVAPSVSYVTLVSSSIRDTDAYGTDSDFFVASIGISKSL
ncbi:MAG: hypothetical protein ACYSR4_04380 [Planctomycetota bacterium]|jgi:hypothetical protein